MRSVAVVSVSLTDKNLEVLNRLQKEFGLAGRSETIRACVRSAEATLKEREALTGIVEGVLIAVHRQAEGENLEESVHHRLDIITTQVHTHLNNGKCLDVFFIKGEAEGVKELLTAFQRDECLEYIKFVPS